MAYKDVLFIFQRIIDLKNLFDSEENVNKYRHFFDLTSDDYDDVVNHFMCSKPYYESFEQFLDDCGLL